MAIDDQAPFTCEKSAAGRLTWTNWRRCHAQDQADRRLQPQQPHRPHPDRGRDGRHRGRRRARGRLDLWPTRSTAAPSAPTDVQTPSFYGRYDKVLAMGSMSKAYGLPGLRIGWVVGPGRHP